MVTERTGLLLDPYFSGTKLTWLLDHVDGARDRAARGELAFGTVDSFLIWRLTGGRVHATDATNAARTLLYDIRTRPLGRGHLRPARHPDGDAARGARLRRRLRHHPPRPLRPPDPDPRRRRRPAGRHRRPGLLRARHAQVHLRHRLLRLLNTGDRAGAPAANRLLATIAYQLDGKPTYALEGSIFIAGAVVQWLRDGLKIIRDAAETQALAEAADPGQALYLVPAFTGLGAP